MTTAIGNHSQPASAVWEFLHDAERAGCYTRLQAKLLGVAFRKLLNAIPDLAEPTVAELIDRRERILADESVKKSSARTYLSRITRLLEDFVRWHRRDLKLWKTEQTRKGPSAQQTLFPSSSQDSGSSAGHMVVYPIRLPTGRGGELRLPPDLNAAEINAVAQQLSALRAVLEAQAASLRVAETEGPLE